MSKFVVPGDLHCFASCGRAFEKALDGQGSRSGIGQQRCWCVPDGWKACASCMELPKARVAAAPDELVSASADDCSCREPREG